MNSIKDIWGYLKTHKKLVIPVFLLIIVIVYFSIPKKKADTFTIVQAKRSTVTELVSGTGKVKPAQAVDLGFEKSGKITAVYFDVGQRVNEGDVLAEVSNADLSAQVRQAGAAIKSAQASLDIQKANLAAVKKGSRAEDLQTATTTLNNAKTNLDTVKSKADSDLVSAYAAAMNVLSDAYAKADDAVRKQTDGMYITPETMHPGLTFIVSSSQAKVDAEWGRYKAGDELQKWNDELNALRVGNPTNEQLDAALLNAKLHLSVVRDFMDKAMLALVYQLDLSTTNETTYKANVSLGRTNVNTAASSVTTQYQAIQAQKSVNESLILAAQSKVDDAQNALNLKNAGSTKEQIDAQEAQVALTEAQLESAQASYQNVMAQYDKSLLIAPISGVVSKRNIEPGEIAPVSTPAMSLITDSKFQLEVNVPDVDIAKVKVGNEADVTLDAYGETVKFKAKVVSIDPAETVIEGVPTYRIKLQFIQEDERVKSGMTANIDILTNQKEAVINVPQRAVYTKDGEKYVKVQDAAGIVSEVKVETGIKDTNSGNIEIKTGLFENQNIVIPNSSF